MTTWTKKLKTTEEGFSGNVKIEDDEKVNNKEKIKNPSKKKIQQQVSMTIIDLLPKILKKIIILMSLIKK